MMVEGEGVGGDTCNGLRSLDVSGAQDINC